MMDTVLIPPSSHEPVAGEHPASIVQSGTHRTEGIKLREIIGTRRQKSHLKAFSGIIYCYLNFNLTSLSPSSMQGRSLQFSLFIVAWLAALVLPVCFLKLSLWIGVAFGVALPLVWLFWLPGATRRAASVAFPMVLLQLGALVAWAAIGFRLWR
jgi:hypothetical protein